MTDQELFDKVAAHLRTQNAKAMNADCQCMYRAPDGKRCAAGCLILDEHYAPNIEGLAITGNLVWARLSASGVADAQAQLVQELQIVHDNCQIDQWKSELARVAGRHNLAPLAAP